MIEVFRKRHLHDLIKSLSGFAFLLNPSTESLVEDLEALIDVPYVERPFEAGNTYFKTPEEVDAFFSSKTGVKKENLSDYESKYKALILSVSNIFEIPFAFQSCLLFKESRFDKSAKSYIGAMGVAQFTKDTYNFLSNALRAGKNHIDEELLKANELNLLTDEETKILDKYLYNKNVFKRMYSLWGEYLKTNKLDVIELKKSNYHKNLYTPEYSIGLSALYLYYLKHRVEFDAKKYVDEISADHPDFILSLAGAYNQGARRVLKAVNKSKENPDFSKWISYQSKVRETRGYIKSIRTCMKSENSESLRKSPLAATR